MKNINNFLLMLKQGIKGVFKFKAQFIIIIILAFIATFILSVSLSTERRINASYNDIVKKVKRFDYSGSVQLNSPVDGNNDALVFPVALNNAGSISIEQYQDSGSERILAKSYSNFNFVFSDVYSNTNGDAYESFMTKAINDLPKKMNPTANDVDGFAKTLRNAYFNELISELDSISNAAKNSEPLSSVLTTTKYSSIGQYTYNNPFWYKKFVAANTSSPTDSPNYKPKEEVINYSDKEIFFTLEMELAQLAGFSDQAIRTYAPANLNNAQWYEFLFGKKFSDVVPNNQNWIVNDTNRPYSINVNNKDKNQTKDAYNFLEVSPANESNNSKDPDAGYQANIKQALQDSGFRGIANPLINSKGSSKTDFGQVSSLNFMPYNANVSNSNYYNRFDTTNKFYFTENDQRFFVPNYNDYFINNPASGIGAPYGNDLSLMGITFLANQKMAAGAAGFDFNIRREMTYFDNTNQLKYRGIILDKNENYNLTVLKGTMPGSNNIAISEQFAKKNHLGVGDIIRIGNSAPTISGIVTDAFSYMPAQDIKNPIPNPTVSGYIFGSAGVLQSMSDQTHNSDDNDDAFTKTYNYFLWNNKDSNSMQTRHNLFNATLFDTTSSAYSNFQGIKSYVDSNGKSYVGTSDTHLSTTSFNSSPYRYSWTLEPLVFKVYSAVTYTASAIIALIAIIALVVCVRKTIDFNSKQIGILKAMGEEPKSISVSYLSYSLVIAFIVVPIAWIIGIVLQIPFSNMFLTYFSAQPQVVLWDWISLVIAFGVLGIFSGIVAFSSAYALTNKPVTNILVSSIKWGHLWILDVMKRTIFKKAPFNTRFSITLTSSGSKQIVLMTVVMLVASFLMTASLAIPSIAITANSSYYKSIKYSNQYNNVQETGNAPLSKNALSFWQGHDYLNSQYVDGNLTLDNTGNKYGYYKDPEDYTATLSGANPIPQYVYDATGTMTNGTPAVQNAYPYILKNEQKMLDVIGSFFGTNFYSNIGQGFSVGLADKMYGLLLHTYSDLFDENQDNYTDDAKMSKAQELSGWLTDSIPKVIGAIVNGNSSGGLSIDSGDKSASWKEDVMNVIYKVVPSFVKAYVQQSASRIDQYVIAWQNDIYIPGKETLVTYLDGTANAKGKNTALDISGLDEDQNSVVLDKEAKNKAYLPEDITEQINSLIYPNTVSNGKNNIDSDRDDIVYNDAKIYDHTTHQLTIPVIPNKQAESAYSLKQGNQVTDWNNNIQQIQFYSKNGNYINLPKSAWVYDDTDFVNYVNSKNNIPNLVDSYNPSTTYNSMPNGNWVYDTTTDNATTSYYLNPYNLDNNKFTYNENIIDGQLQNKANMMMDWKTDASGTLTGSYIRPTYEYKNLRLMMPTALADPNTIINNTNNGAADSSWNKQNISANDIPQSVKDGYIDIAKQQYKNDSATLDNVITGIKTGSWFYVNPYDIAYQSKDQYAKMATSPLRNLTDGPSYWYANALTGSIAPLRMDKSQSVGMLSTNGIKINLKSVGSIDSYNDKLIVMDSDIANMLSGFSTGRDYAYNYQTFDKSGPIRAGTVAPDGTTSEFDRWKLQDVNKIINNDTLSSNDLWMSPYESDEQDALNYSPHRWYNGKLSNDEEATGYTTEISFTRTDRWGQFSIGGVGGSTDGGPNIIESSSLLSEAKALIHQIAVLAISIGAMLMIAIIITASLLTMLTGDIYIAQYKRFMVLMRALGYSNRRIFSYTFGTVSIMALGAWIIGTIVAWAVVFAGVSAMWASGFAIPAGITWWPIIASLVIMFISYAGSLWVSSGKARKENPSVLLTATAE